VVWDRDGEEGIRVTQMGWEGRKKEGRKEERDDLAPNKIPGSATGSQCAAAVPVYLTNVVILKILSTS
jgi:hypothetical protein